MAAHMVMDVKSNERADDSRRGFNASKYPKEIANYLGVFKHSLDEVESVLAPLENAQLADIHSKLNALDRAKLELVSAYTINSMFWMYLCTQGVNPRDHPIKHELGRIQKYMNRVKEIIDKEKAAKLDKGAAKRFVNAALSDASRDKADKGKRKITGDLWESGPSKKR